MNARALPVAGLAFAAALLLAPQILSGQETPDQPADGAAEAGASAGQQALDALRANAPNPGPLPGASSPFMPKVWCADIADVETRKVCWAAYRASLSYYETGLAHRARVIRWQHVSTIVIFWVVLGLVAIGVYFAWLQFARAMAIRPTAGEPGPTHSIELSVGGIKVSSPVLGVIILTLSLAFFYLYLVHAYPIQEIF